MEYNGEELFEGERLIWKKSIWSEIYYFWMDTCVGHVMIGENQFEAFDETIALGQHKIYSTIDEAHEFMKHCVSVHKEEIKRQVQERKALKERELQMQIDYKDKFHHLELKDITPESEIYFTDLISTRLSNVMRAASLVTLKDLSELTKKDFLRYRNSGKKLAEEVEQMFAVAGLSWAQTETKEPKTRFYYISDEDLLAECKRRGLI